MSEATIDCPKCGLKDSHGFYEGTENGAPHGAGYWPMHVSEANQNCDCDFTEVEMAELMDQAWKPFQDADNAYAEALAAEYFDQDDPTPTQPVYHPPGCYCGASILCVKNDRFLPGDVDELDPSLDDHGAPDSESFGYD